MPSPVPVPFNDLEGKTIVSYSLNNRQLRLLTNGYRYDLQHHQDCCEEVHIEDICGDMDDLVGHLVAQAAEVSSEDPPPSDRNPSSYTWTFYKIATIQGRVTIRFYGESNGNYSESVRVERIKL